MSSGKVTVGNVCFLIDEVNKKILLLERSFEPMKDLFTGVGGKTRFEEDINLSCIREVKEETGLDVKDLKLKGVIKTLLAESNSSWILFVYTSNDFSGRQINCPEGTLKWVMTDEVFDLKLIGFIKEMMPFILDKDSLIEGTIKHDIRGNVLSKRISLRKSAP